MKNLISHHITHRQSAIPSPSAPSTKSTKSTPSTCSRFRALLSAVHYPSALRASTESTCSRFRALLSAVRHPSAFRAFRTYPYLSVPIRTKFAPSTPSTKSTSSRSTSPRFLALAPAMAALLLSGCATETIAKGLATKNTSGNGTVVDTHIGINADNKIPEIRTLFISGDFATTKSGTNAVSYREESSASVWNASSITRKRFLSITLHKDEDVAEAIKAVAEVFKTAETAAAADEKKAEKETDAQKDEVRPAQ